jgi:imidazole glycerol-phosphate synthase subunit HisH
MTASARQARNVGVIDYRAGNIQSIGNAFEHLGAQVVRVQEPSAIEGCTHLVLPGVGAFGFCAERLRASGLLGAVEQWALEQRNPLLGICVGMQLLAQGSDESPGVRGLGWLGGHVRRIPSQSRTLHVPHVGWNTARFTAGLGEIAAGEEADFYFDHSYAYGQPAHGEILASCTHGIEFSAAVRRDNVLAAQFHPEKSQSAGLRFLRAFLAT